ncbi:MAG: hypothetical protein ACOX4U_00385 [Anaerovoracaceae bacterium]|jgi:hypothetical protein
MARLDWKEVMTKHKEAIAAVATKNDVDMGVGLDMLIAMTRREGAEKDYAIKEYGPVPEMDVAVFLEDVNEVYRKANS